MEGRQVEISIDVPGRNVKIIDNGTGYSAWRISPAASLRSERARSAARAREDFAAWDASPDRILPGTQCSVPGAGESKVSEIRWDCQKLKNILRSSEEHHDLARGRWARSWNCVVFPRLTFPSGSSKLRCAASSGIATINS